MGWLQSRMVLLLGLRTIHENSLILGKKYSTNFNDSFPIIVFKIKILLNNSKSIEGFRAPLPNRNTDILMLKRVSEKRLGGRETKDSGNIINTGYNNWILDNDFIILIEEVLMTKQSNLLVVFCLLVSLTLTQNCVGSLSDDLIQTGNVDVVNPGTNGRQTLVQTQVSYLIPASGFQVTYSLLDLQYNTSQGIDFTIRGGRNGTSNNLVISLLLLQDKKWDRIRVSFLVHSRKDIWAGAFTSSPYAFNSAQNNSGALNTQVQGAVDGWTVDNSENVFLKAVFLSGLQTGLSNFSFFLTNVKFDKVRGVIGVTITNSTRAIDMITISYVIFLSPHPRFTFDSFNYPGSTSVADYGMVGSSGFSSGGLSGARYYGISIQSILLNCFGSLCSTTCISKFNCTQANGLQSGNDCGICPSNTRYNETRKACVPIVISCGANEQLINGTTCQCVFGFLWLGDVCVSRCGVNQEWTGTACVCARGNANITNVCRPCPPGSAPNANRNSCDCGTGSVFDQASLRCVPFFGCQENATGVIEAGVYRCKCNADFFVSGQTCVYCPAPASWNTTSLRCFCPNVNQNWNGRDCVSCGAGQFFNTSSRQCECFSPRILVAGECKCPNNLIWNNQTSKCECPNKFETLNSSSNCICISPYIRLESGECGLVCTENEWWTSGECRCKTPFVRISGKCTINCPANERWNTIECVCVNGFFRVNGTCATCPIGTVYNSTTRNCQNLCGANEVIVNGSQCACRQNFYRVNSVCSQCPTGSGYNPTTAKCVACGQNQASSNSLCVCRPTFYRINEVCGQCPAGTSYNLQKQVCDPLCTGVNEFYDGKNCVCVLNFFRINGICSQCSAGTTYSSASQTCVSICKANQSFDGTTCVCASGFNRINGNCGQCPAGTTYNRATQSCDSTCKVNQVLVNGVCICAQNFVRVNGVCTACGLGTVFNSVTLVCDPICKANEVFDGIKCVCAQGFLIINGICDRCPTGNYYDDTLKRCVIQPTCPTGAEWNQVRLRCECKVADQNLINGICQSCTTNAGWNGTQCVCRTGFFLIGTECLTCDINSSYNTTLKNCVCNRGFYGDRTSCLKCDATCGRCSGPNTNQCLDCLDVSFTLANGVCSKTSACVTGMYLSGNVCKTCSAYCTTCKDENTCTGCTSGFTLSSVNLTPTLTYSMCEETCGDGNRFEYACDDGNTNNNDGCNNQCEIETGWSCTGGTTTSKSVCMKLIPTRSVITPKGAVQLSGKVMQGITLSYLPDGLTAGGCPQCSEVLMVSIIQAQVIPSFRVNFLPTTQFKYLIEFDFQGIFGIPPFTFTLRINPDFARFFSTEDMAQLLTIRVDPAVLARGQEVVDLTFDEIMGIKIPIADGDLSKVFK